MYFGTGWILSQAVGVRKGSNTRQGPNTSLQTLVSTLLRLYHTAYLQPQYQLILTKLIPDYTVSPLTQDHCPHCHSPGHQTHTEHYQILLWPICCSIIHKSLWVYSLHMHHVLMLNPTSKVTSCPPVMLATLFLHPPLLFQHFCLSSQLVMIKCKSYS